MDLKTIKEKTLQLIREYSNNGSVIGTGDNADYLVSINGLISDSQLEIAKKSIIIKQYMLPSTPNAETDLYKVYEKPGDMVTIINCLKDYITNIPYKEDYKNILIPKNLTGITITYEKRPTILTKDTPDSYELEIDEEYQHICCYKAAAHIIIDENPDISKSLLSEYNRLLYTITPKDLIYNSNSINSIYTGGW